MRRRPTSGSRSACSYRRYVIEVDPVVGHRCAGALVARRSRGAAHRAGRRTGRQRESVTIGLKGTYGLHRRIPRTSLVPLNRREVVAPCTRTVSSPSQASQSPPRSSSPQASSCWVSTAARPSPRSSRLLRRRSLRSSPPSPRRSSLRRPPRSTPLRGPPRSSSSPRSRRRSPRSPPKSAPASRRGSTTSRRSGVPDAAEWPESFRWQDPLPTIEPPLNWEHDTWRTPYPTFEGYYDRPFILDYGDTFDTLTPQVESDMHAHLRHPPPDHGGVGRHAGDA